MKAFDGRRWCNHADHRLAWHISSQVELPFRTLQLYLGPWDALLYPGRRVATRSNDISRTIFRYDVALDDTAFWQGSKRPCNFMTCRALQVSIGCATHRRYKKAVLSTQSPRKPEPSKSLASYLQKRPHDKVKSYSRKRRHVTHDDHRRVYETPKEQSELQRPTGWHNHQAWVSSYSSVHGRTSH